MSDPRDKSLNEYIVDFCNGPIFESAVNVHVVFYTDDALDLLNQLYKFDLRDYLDQLHKFDLRDYLGQLLLRFCLVVLYVDNAPVAVLHKFDIRDYLNLLLKFALVVALGSLC